MGTITVRIKKNPQLCYIIADSGTLYYEYSDASVNTADVAVSAKTVIGIIESGTEIKYSDPEQNEILIAAPECSQFHICFVDGSDNHNDVEVSRAIFLEYLKYQLEDERTRWKYREYCDLFSDDTSAEAKRIATDVPLDEIIVKRDSLRQLHIAMKSLTAIQRRRLLQHFVQGKTVREIGKDENRHYTCVDKSILKAVSTLKKKLEGD